MSNRIRTAPWLLLAAFLASVVSTATTRVAARAANDCLNGPNHQAPPGRHWYYRIDGSSNRRCWFLGDEGQHVIQTGSRRPSASSAPALPRQTMAAIQPSLADAQAELSMVMTPTEPAHPEKITEVVPDASPSETLSPPSARDPEGETSVMSNGMIDGQSRTESRTELLPRAADREPAAEVSAKDTTAGPLRVRLALLLIILGLSTIAGCLIFRPSAAIKAGRDGVERRAKRKPLPAQADLAGTLPTRPSRSGR